MPARAALPRPGVHRCPRVPPIRHSLRARSPVALARIPALPCRIHPGAPGAPAVMTDYTLLVDILGWIGVALYVTAYYMVSAGRVSGRARSYQYLNLAGA